MDYSISQLLDAAQACRAIGAENDADDLEARAAAIRVEGCHV